MTLVASLNHDSDRAELDVAALPNLADYECRKTIPNIDFAGTSLPGLHGSFYRRAVANGRHSVGVYTLAGVEIFRAWGWVGEEHCSWHAVRHVPQFCEPVAAGTGISANQFFAPFEWDGPHQGCPEIAVLSDQNDRPNGVELRTPLPKTAGDASYTQRTPQHLSSRPTGHLRRIFRL